MARKDTTDETKPTAAKFVLSETSRARLDSCHAALVDIIERAIILTDHDFMVGQTLRTKEEQKRLFAAGKSRTLNSKHLVQSDGTVHAADLWAWDHGIKWAPKERYFSIARALATAVLDRRKATGDAVDLIWGAVWDRPLSTLRLDDLDAEMREYAARHTRKTNTQPLFDLVHFQLFFGEL